MNDRIDAYAKFITNQLIKEGAVSSSNDKNATQYERHKKLAMRSPDLKMAGVDGYFHKDNNMGDQGFIIKHGSGNVSHTVIDDGDNNEKHYEMASRRDNPHLSDSEHKEVAKAIAANE